jgi:hypothetical protein
MLKGAVFFNGLIETQAYKRCTLLHILLAHFVSRALQDIDSCKKITFSACYRQSGR